MSALTPLGEMVAALNEFQAEVLLGYPSVGALLATEQLAGRLRIAPRVIAFGSEPFPVETRARVEAASGIEPGEHYSSTEAPMIASSTPAHPRRWSSSKTCTSSRWSTRTAGRCPTARRAPRS